MLTVVLKSKNVAGDRNLIVRHVPFNSLPELVNEEIDFIQADGDELQEIKAAFDSSIPMPTRRVVRWYGDLAKTIYCNL